MHRYVSYCTQIKANLTSTLLNTYLPLAFNYSLHCQYFHKKCIFSFLTSVQMFAEPNHAFFNKCISWGQVIPLYDILMTYWTEVPVWELISYKHFLFLYTLKCGQLLKLEKLRMCYRNTILYILFVMVRAWLHFLGFPQKHVLQLTSFAYSSRANYHEQNKSCNFILLSITLAFISSTGQYKHYENTNI